MNPDQCVHLDSWQHFKSRLESYFRLSPIRRNQLIFRGHADSEWPLLTTLDREQEFADDYQRNTCIKRLMMEFRREASGLRVDRGLPRNAEAWELLARHHGLPSPILDWTTSPYVAAYFAFIDQAAPVPGFVSVWILDREAFASDDVPEAVIIDDLDQIQFNPRAIEQRGVFLRVGTTRMTIAGLFSKFLSRYDIPSSDRNAALADLDEMLVNGRTLFRDLDGAARSAAWRAMQEVQK